MISSDLESLFLSHEQADSARCLVFQQFDFASPPLFPFTSIIVKAIQLALSAPESVDVVLILSKVHLKACGT